MVLITTIIRLKKIQKFRTIKRVIKPYLNEKKIIQICNQQEDEAHDLNLF